jgi:DNA mismatch repair protein MutS
MTPERGLMPDLGRHENAARRRYGDLVQQYLEIREQHPGVLILFRVGSFYEILFEDAELVSGVLGLKLGDRPSGGTAGPVPQCGFTYQALDSFLPRLLARGYRVAVCEEGAGEGPGPRERSVVRTLTPGTVTDSRLLREDRPTYLAALVVDGSAQAGLAWTDLAAGEFRAGEFELEDAAAELQRLEPAEILLPRDVEVPGGLTANRVITAVDLGDAASRVHSVFPEGPLNGLPQAEAAAGMILAYLEQTQASPEQQSLDLLQRSESGDMMRLDVATQRHLEIVETEHAHSRDGSLLGTMDRTVTPMGRRMLREWLLRPLTDLKKIATRHRIVNELIANDALREMLRTQLKTMSDLERLAGRAANRSASIDDLRALASAAGALPDLALSTQSCTSSFLRALGRPRLALSAFAQEAARLLAPEESPHAIDPRADPDLEQALSDIDAAARWRDEYVTSIRRATGIARVRIERSATQGLFLETPANTPVPATWVRRGGLQKVERYGTAELEAHAVRLAEAESTVASATARLLAELRESAAASADEARDLSKHLAAADALLSYATVAAERGWVAPTVDGSGELFIEGGRHPVVEAIGGAFQPNDTRLSAGTGQDQVVVLTGPNMAGKSTWMRQTALIVLLAQAGSYVPAARARIGIVDAIFTRIGAVDDLTTGHSTFMIEMLETASVLRKATSSSLVVLDEIGRGTSTHDGMAIAWAVVEHLARGPVRPRTIAATHYHELAALNAVYKQVTLRQAVVEEQQDGIVFPHRIEDGAADRSFGIEVARLADLPPEVLARARQVADAIEPISGEIARRLGGLERD